MRYRVTFAAVRRWLLLLVFLLPWPCAVYAAVCPVLKVPLSLTGGQVGGTSIVLSDGSVMGDNGLGATLMAWDEPMVLRQRDGKTCGVDPVVGIIASPMYVAGNRILYVFTYSGSEFTLYAVALKNCDVLWNSNNFSFGDFSPRNQEFVFTDIPPVRIGPLCLPLKR